MALPNTGYPVTKTDLDNTMGRLVVSLRNDLIAVASLKTQLDDSTLLNDTNLALLGYTSGDITLIRASFTDLTKLWDISRAAATQSPANDFWFNAKHLAGLNLS